MGTESLYVHLDFRSIEAYGPALGREIAAWRSVHAEGTSAIRTLFFGMSTEGRYSSALLLDTAAILRSTFEFDHQAEITLEIYPGTPIGDLSRAGITRLSMSCGRHSALDIARALEGVPAGIQVSVDVTAGPDNQEHWKEFIMHVALLPLHHISVTFEPGFALYELTVKVLTLCGFDHYEVMNFARPGHKAEHSLAYWQRKPYKGFGLGANSFNGKVRTRNTSNLIQYLSGSEHVVFQEILSSEQELLEVLMFGLQQTRGISWTWVPRSKSVVHAMVDRGYAYYTPDGFALTLQGFGALDSIVVALAYDNDMKRV